MMNWIRINYLNYGDSLSALVSFFDERVPELCSKEELVNEIQRNGKPNNFMLEIIKSYGGRKAKRIDLRALRKDIRESVCYKNNFSEYGCRGFSYVVHQPIDFEDESLRDDINLRIALMPAEDLFYPPRIRRYLRRAWLNHYLSDRMPSICFALGKMTEGECFIFVMQSDLAFRKPAFIRDHFRGWRKLLCMSIAQIIKQKCETIYIPNAHDVTRCCHPSRKPTRTPNSWLVIYNRTAEDFQFKPVCHQKPVNIQVYRDLAPVFVKEFFKQDINSIRGFK